MLSIVWLAFVGIMVAAAVMDLVSYRIPNLLVVALLVLFGLVAAVNWGEVEWLSHISAGLVIFGAGLFLYAIRQMGAGDVKLLAAAALWSGIFSLPPLLLYVSLCGVTGMLVILPLRAALPLMKSHLPVGTALPRVLTKGQGIPYAIAIGPGAIIASFGFAPWLWNL